MKLAKSWPPAVLVLITFSLFSWRPWSIFPAGEKVSIEQDSLSTHGEEAYGFDRLEETDGEQWLPEVEIAATSELKSSIHQLDTIAWSTWQQYAQRIIYYPAGSPLFPLEPGLDVQLWRPRGTVFPAFLHHLQAWTSFREQGWSGAWPSSHSLCALSQTTIVLLDDANLEALLTSGQLNYLPQALTEYPALLVYFGDREPYELIDLELPLLWLPTADEVSEAMAAQALFGAMDIQLPGGSPVEAVRLGHAPPEAVGIDREVLNRMDRYVSRAIRKRAMPGCQILVAKAGKVVFEKSYGYHTYDKEQPVRNHDVYDVASVTKAAATTLGLMRLHEHQQFGLEDRLREVLPTYSKTNLRYLRIRHLLSHHTGLQSNLPIAQWLREESSFRSYGGEDYPYALDQDFYLKAGIREAVLAQLADLRIPRRLYYRYSDVNFLLLQELLETQSGLSMDKYLDAHFYAPLGLQRLQFRPGLSLPEGEIVPTEHDKKWRKGLVHGEVHDESAALLGGVAGHAGLFSNARDLATIFQLLLNEGEYGGRKYLEPETIATFTKRNPYNYRAYGFDRLAAHSKSLRAYGASLETFGHTGFTGTCAWADPEHDLIFIFLSNRIYPDKHNDRLQKLGVRERLHKIIYQSLGTAKEEV